MEPYLNVVSEITDVHRYPYAVSQTTSKSSSNDDFLKVLQRAMEQNGGKLNLSDLDDETLTKLESLLNETVKKYALGSDGDYEAMEKLLDKIMSLVDKATAKSYDEEYKHMMMYMAQAIGSMAQIFNEYVPKTYQVANELLAAVKAQGTTNENALQAQMQLYPQGSYPTPPIGEIPDPNIPNEEIVPPVVEPPINGDETDPVVPDPEIPGSGEGTDPVPTDPVLPEVPGNNAETPSDPTGENQLPEGGSGVEEPVLPENTESSENSDMSGNEAEGNPNGAPTAEIQPDGNDAELLAMFSDVVPDSVKASVSETVATAESAYHTSATHFAERHNAEVFSYKPEMFDSSVIKLSVQQSDILDSAAEDMFNQAVNIVRERLGMQTVTEQETADAFDMLFNEAKIRNSLNQNVRIEEKPDELQQLLSQVNEAVIPQTPNTVQQNGFAQPVELVSVSVTQQIADEIQTKMQSLTNGETEFTVELNPEELGKVTIRLTTAGERIAVALIAENAETAKMLQARAELMQGHLQDSGVELERYTVYQEEGQEAYYNQDGGSKQQREQEEEMQQPVFVPEDEANLAEFYELLGAMV